MNSIKNLLLLSARQRKVCRRLESGRGRLFRMAYAWCHNADTAEEVVQETMIKALNNVDQVKNIDALDSWLFRVLSNCFLDNCRRHREHIDIDDVVLVAADTPESIHSQNEMLDFVRAAIASLPFKHRQVVTLVDIESFSYADVAHILDVPIGTVMSRLNRARQTLRRLFEDSHHNHKKATLKVVR